jgi:2-(1,2-epoxy-1,2-dihydrophenyl)acetyl-CoA isomerase
MMKEERGHEGLPGDGIISSNLDAPECLCKDIAELRHREKRAMSAQQKPTAAEPTRSDAVKLERQGGVAILRLDDPATMNALSPSVKAGMTKHVPALLTDDSVRCIVITGTGKAFCAGGDIRSMKEPAQRQAPLVRKRMKSGHSWSRPLLDCDKPIICAVNGAAVGGGLAMAMLGDIVFASSNAYFMGGYSMLGALPDLGLLQTLTWAVGSLRAKEIIMLNRRYSAEEAVAIGLANRVVAPEKLMEVTMAAAHEIADGPAAMMSLSKEMMKRAYESSTEAFFEQEAIAQAVCFGSEEFDEGVDAFLNKRRPRFVKR